MSAMGAVWGIQIETRKGLAPGLKHAHRRPRCQLFANADVQVLDQPQALYSYLEHALVVVEHGAATRIEHLGIGFGASEVKAQRSNVPLLVKRYARHRSRLEDAMAPASP